MGSGTEDCPPVLQRAAKPVSVSFRSDIEGLRAIAILLVVGYHAAVPGFSGGYVGVDIFFVLSGYLITGLLVGEIDKTGTLDFRRFYARRARRLLPALTLTLLITILAGFTIYPPSEVVHGGLATTAVSTAAYASNLYFATWNTDYFAPNRDNNPLLHTWSLSVEEQFYLLWPLFIILALKIFGSRNDQTATRRRLLAWMAIVAVVSFTLSLYWMTRSRSLAYFASPARAWEFALGGLVVLLPLEAAFSWIPSNVSGWAGLGGIFIAAVAFDRTTTFPGIAVLLPAFSTVLVLRSGSTRSPSALARVLGVRSLQGIGRLSYSWYLWHWPVIVMGSALLLAPSLPVRLGLAALSLGLSAATYWLVENPIRNARTLAGSHGYSLAMFVVLAILGISASIAWKQSSIRKAQEPAQLRFNRAYDDFAAALLNDTCTGKMVDSSVRTCTFAAGGSPSSVVLLGDSHAAQWFPALEPISIKRGFRLETLVKLGCPAVNAPFVDSGLGRVFTECEEWRSHAIEKIRQIRPVLTVVSSTEAYPFRDDEWNNGISSIVKDLAESSQSVLILRDTPRVSFDMVSCLARLGWRPAFIPSPACQFSFPRTSNVYDFQRSAAAQYKNVFIADMSTSICPKGLCTGRRDDLILYRDADHLTASFVKSLEVDLDRQINRALGTKFTSYPEPILVSSGITDH